MKKQPEVTAATRQKLMDAFWSIYKEKAIDKISIAEITRITGNNRGTFYHYFKDAYDVLEQIEDGLIKQVNTEVKEALSNYAFKEDARDINLLYSFSAPIFKRHEEKLFTLLGKDGDPKFTSKFKGKLPVYAYPFLEFAGRNKIFGLSDGIYLLCHDRADGKMV